jgi:FMN reductase
MSVTVIVGNPRPGSRTLATAVEVARRLTDAEPDTVIDLATLGAGILDRADPALMQAVTAVRHSRLVVVASPTYKATYTGLLKLFLEQFGADELAGVTAIPVLLGGDLRHSLAVEVHLRPVLIEIGLSTPTAGLWVVDSEGTSTEEFTTWVTRARAALANRPVVAS